MDLWYVHPFPCFLNNAASELTGYFNEDFQKGRLFWQRCVHPDDRARISGVWKELQTQVTKLTYEYRFFPKGKHEEIWIKDISHSFEMSDGKIGGIISVYSDLYPGREARHGLLKSDGELARIIRGLVYNLRNHVHTISGAVELSQMTYPKIARSDDIVKAAEGTNKLAEDVKDYFFPTMAQPSGVRLDSIIENVALRCESHFLRRGIRLELQHDGDLPKLVARCAASHKSHRKAG